MINSTGWMGTVGLRGSMRFSNVEDTEKKVQREEREEPCSVSYSAFIVNAQQGICAQVNLLVAAALHHRAEKIDDIR